MKPDAACSPAAVVRRHRFPSWLLLAILLAGVAAPPRPARAGLFSIGPSKERQIGEDAARQIEAQERIVTGPVADWVDAIGQRLAAVSNPEFKYSFKVIDSNEINAFTLPGGYIYVFTGLRKVARSDDELAAVLAHEITHAEEHHFARQYKTAQKRGFGLSILSMVVGLPNLAQQALGIVDFAMTQKYSRTHEFEADKFGMLRMARAGFNPHGMVSLLDRLSKEDHKGNTLDHWFGDHPDAARRISASEQEEREIQNLASQNSPLVRPAYGTWTTSGTVGTP